MTDSGRVAAVASIGLSALLMACTQSGPNSWQVADTAGGTSAGTLGNAGIDGAHTSGAAGAMGGVSAGASSAGSAATAGEQPVPGGLNVSGRWAMFGWEDPVGVQIHQSGDSLSGTGCGIGTPPALKATGCSPTLSGTVFGSKVTFAFNSAIDILPGNYLADLVVSEDGKRMAGRFGIESINREYWFVWLPVKTDDWWLSPPANDFPRANERLDLKLSAGEANDPRFDPNAVYQIAFWLDGIVGDFGAFYASEMTRSDSGQIEVGPVSPTVPELPVFLSFASTGNVFTGVTARLSNGHSFTFDVIPDATSSP